MEIAYFRYRKIRNQAQHKLGNDVYRSIWYRENWGEDWQPIARSVSRLRRWALRKYNNPPSMYRQRSYEPLSKAA